VNSRKLRGFSTKSPEPAGFDLVDLGWLDLDPLDLDPTTVVARRRWDWTGASDLNPTAENACERPSNGGRRRPAVSGGGTRRRARTRAPEHDSKRGWHLRAARKTTKHPRAARAAESRRHRRSAWRRGKKTPASYNGRCDAWGRPQAARLNSSPPCASPELLLDDEATMTARIDGGGELGFRRLAVRAKVAARFLGRGSRGWRPAINSPGRALGVRTTQGRRRIRPARVGVGLCLESGSATGWG
jgi:hypothetical protein